MVGDSPYAAILARLSCASPKPNRMAVLGAWFFIFANFLRKSPPQLQSVITGRG
jgi:hypothetical protein